MFRLVVDIGDDVPHRGRADTDCAIPVLPAEFGCLAPNSGRRVGLELAKDVGDCPSRGKIEQQVGFAPRANNKVAASQLGFSPFGRSSHAAGIYPLLSKNQLLSANPRSIGAH